MSDTIAEMNETTAKEVENEPLSLREDLVKSVNSYFK